jgi:hypothetical protein
MREAILGDTATSLTGVPSKMSETVTPGRSLAQGHTSDGSREATWPSDRGPVARPRRDVGAAKVDSLSRLDERNSAFRPIAEVSFGASTIVVIHHRRKGPPLVDFRAEFNNVVNSELDRISTELAAVINDMAATDAIFASTPNS